MSEVHTLLPRLTINELLLRDLLVSPAPCFALGYVEERGATSGFIALRPDIPIPQASTRQGFNFGHCVLGSIHNPVLQLSFEFYGHATYHGLVPAGNPIVEAVLTTMLNTNDYFIFAINPNHSIVAFRAQLEDANSTELRADAALLKNANCSHEQYERAVKAFTRQPSPPGTVMGWV